MTAGRGRRPSRFDNTTQWHCWLRRRGNGTILLQAMGSMRGTPAEPIANVELRELLHVVDAYDQAGLADMLLASRLSWHYRSHRDVGM